MTDSNYVNTAHTQEPLTGPSPPSNGAAPHQAHQVGTLSEEDAVEMDDERRAVPDGWVRAFDKASGHHFYVDTKSSRSTWLHPYDDPEYLRSIPESDPAHPQSAAAKAAAKRSSDEQGVVDKATRGMQGGGGEDKKGWLQKTIDKVSGKGNGAEAEQEAIKKYETNFITRRQALKSGDLAGEPMIKHHYAPDPYKYTPPSEPFARKPPSGIAYAFGYPGGYGRKYSPVYGYGRLALSNEEGMLGGFMGSILSQQGVVPGFDKKTNYGFGG